MRAGLVLRIKYIKQCFFQLTFTLNAAMVGWVLQLHEVSAMIANYKADYTDCAK